MRWPAETLDLPFGRIGLPAGTADRVGSPRAAVDVRGAPALHVERVEADVLVRYEAAWADLCTRAIEPNVFMEPAFLLPLLQHVASARRPSLLLVWAENGPASFGRLLGLFPVHLSGWGGTVHGFAHKQTSCGMPLVDRDLAPETIAAALAWLGRAGGRRFGALALSGIATDGPFKAALDAACADGSHASLILEEQRRAVLHRAADGGERLAAFASAKRRKERARQSRRLSEAGVRRYTSARTVAEVAAATERFLALEHRGWKGARGTSLLAAPTLATFCRTMTRTLAADGRCRIDAIEIDGQPVAMGIVLSAGDRGYFWKTAFDEAFGALSPGVHFALELTKAQLADPALAMTDSCAIADHPMIDRLWAHRMAVVDVMVALAPGADARLARCRRWERGRRALRAAAKGVYARARRLARRD